MGNAKWLLLYKAKRITAIVYGIKVNALKPRDAPTLIRNANLSQDALHILRLLLKNVEKSVERIF